MVLRYRKRLAVELLYHKANKKPPTDQSSSSSLNTEDLFITDFNICTNSAKNMKANMPNTKKKPPIVPRRRKKSPGDKDKSPGTSGPAQGTSAPAQGICHMNLRKRTPVDYRASHEGKEIPELGAKRRSKK